MTLSSDYKGYGQVFGSCFETAHGHGARQRQRHPCDAGASLLPCSRACFPLISRKFLPDSDPLDIPSSPRLCKPTDANWGLQGKLKIKPAVLKSRGQKSSKRAMLLLFPTPELRGKGRSNFACFNLPLNRWQKKYLLLLIISKCTKGLKACFEQSWAWQTWCLVTVAKAEPIPGCKGLQMVGLQLIGNRDKGTAPESQPLFSGHKSKRKIFKLPKWCKRTKVLYIALGFLLSPTAPGGAHLLESFTWAKTSPQGLTSAPNSHLKSSVNYFIRIFQLKPGCSCHRSLRRKKGQWNVGEPGEVTFCTRLMCWLFNWCIGRGCVCFKRDSLSVHTRQMALATSTRNYCKWSFQHFISIYCVSAWKPSYPASYWASPAPLVAAASRNHLRQYAACSVWKGKALPQIRPKTIFSWIQVGTICILTCPPAHAGPAAATAEP